MAQAGREPRRVAFVLGRTGRGGTELQSELLVRGLRSRGVEVDVFVLDGSSAVDDEAAGSGFGPGRLVVLGRGRGHGLADPVTLGLVATRLGAELRRGRYDVVHAALARAYIVAPVSAPLRHRPRIVAWRRNLGVHLRHRWATRVDTLAARFSDVIVTNSEAVRQHWVALGGLPASRTRVIYNALESWRFERVGPVGGNGHTLRLVTVGGLRGVKGHDILIEAAADLLADSVPVEVEIVGDGPRRQALVEQAERRGVPLVLPGHLTDPRPRLAAASVYVHPSLSEGASNAVAEAMAQGCAVVATDVGGTAEMIGPTGVLVRPGRPADLATALRTLHADPRRRQSLGDQAQARARDLFDLDRVINDHLDVYAGS